MAKFICPSCNAPDTRVIRTDLGVRLRECSQCQSRFHTEIQEVLLRRIRIEPTSSPVQSNNNSNNLPPQPPQKSIDEPALYKIFVERGGYPAGHVSGTGVVPYEQWQANRRPKPK